MFWGISIMLYEATLVSDQSPFDDCNSGSVAAGVPADSRNGTSTLTVTAARRLQANPRPARVPGRRAPCHPLPAHLGSAVPGGDDPGARGALAHR